VVFSGVSGSGKSSLAFGTLYAEAQRRYLESVSPYARRAVSRRALRRKSPARLDFRQRPRRVPNDLGSTVRDWSCLPPKADEYLMFEGFEHARSSRVLRWVPSLP